MSGTGFDVAVVGAGIVGSAIAFECARRGARVVLLERDEPGVHASGAAAGMLAPCSEAQQAGPFLDLARDSLTLWPEFAAGAFEVGGVDAELHLGGLLRVALTDGDANDVRSRLRWQHDHGITDGTWVDRADAAALEPALTRDTAGAAWYPGEGHVHGRHAVRSLVAAAKAHGAQLRIGTTVDGPYAVVDATHVVLAAGAWLGDLAARFGTPLPITPIHGQLVALADLPHTPRRVLYAGRHGYVVAKQDSTVLSGATEEDRGFDTTPDPAAAAGLEHTARRLLRDAEHVHAHNTWTGLRPATPDRLPLLGPLPGGDGARVVVAGGHYRNGVLLAPATARGIAGMVLDGRTPPNWEAFDPGRFG